METGINNERANQIDIGRVTRRDRAETASTMKSIGTTSITTGMRRTTAAAPTGSTTRAGIAHTGATTARTTMAGTTGTGDMIDS